MVAIYLFKSIALPMFTIGIWMCRPENIFEDLTWIMLVTLVSPLLAWVAAESETEDEERSGEALALLRLFGAWFCLTPGAYFAFQCSSQVFAHGGLAEVFGWLLSDGSYLAVILTLAVVMTIEIANRLLTVTQLIEQRARAEMVSSVSAAYAVQNALCVLATLSLMSAVLDYFSWLDDGRVDLNTLPIKLGWSLGLVAAALTIRVVRYLYGRRVGRSRSRLLLATHR